MIRIVRTNAQDADFLKLVKLLDSNLAETDGDEHEFYNQYNGLDTISHVVLIYNEDKAISCGALKFFGEDKMEVKRMFTIESERGKGLASMVLEALETWAKELGVSSCVLETGIRQPYAIRLYEKNGYKSIPRYGQYANAEGSLCFEKVV